ncbi:MAG: DNA cytosine methyltransferase, partial [Pseudomonadota bacterium]
INDLPLTSEGEHIQGHWQHPGARAYRNHTGSHIDEPSKALKAGDHGVPGGENMLAASNGEVRYFTVREMARLQGFPDTFHVSGSWKGATRQLGNAVPTMVGEYIGSAIAGILNGSLQKNLKDAA